MLQLGAKVAHSGGRWAAVPSGTVQTPICDSSILNTLLLSCAICRLLATLIYGARAMPFGSRAALGTGTKTPSVQGRSVN